MTNLSTILTLRGILPDGRPLRVVERHAEENGAHRPPRHHDPHDVEAHGRVVIDEAEALVLGALRGRVPEEAGAVHEVAEDDGAGDGAEAADEDRLKAEGEGLLLGENGSGS